MRLRASTRPHRRRAARLGAALAPLLAVAAAATAHAGVERAVSVMAPGQSGFVSTSGLDTGSGSPHLYDQQPLLTAFRYKSALFGRPGELERPRRGVRIVRDRFGVPAVTARSAALLWWGAGYAVAQDRLAQLELFRRRARGRLAELLGPGRLADDIAIRRDFYTARELGTLLRRLPRALRGRFAAYRDGVNAWIRRVRRRPRELPAEFAALGIAPRPWSTIDSAAIGVQLARTVPSGDGQELRNVQALRALGPAGFERMLPLRRAGQVATIPPAEGRFPSQPGRTRAQERDAFARSRRFVAALPLPAEATPTAPRASLGGAGGSYAFAVRRPRRSWLFNAPQLGFSAPELFVELELHGPGLDVRGVTAPGIPLIAAGSNRHVAWGVTSGAGDDDDLYAESLAGPERYRFRGRLRRMSCRFETFRVRGGDARRERFCRTVHGPVQARAGGVAYARRWATWRREFDTLIGLAGVNAARSVRDVDRALARVSWNENVVAADSAGSIGYWHPGLLPLRPRRYDERLPFPGTGEAEWRGFLAVRRRPHAIDPRRGWLANWNNVPSAGWTSGDGPALERLGGPFHRAALLERLVRALARRPSFDGVVAVVRRAGTTAQQRPLARARLAAAARGASGPAAAVLSALLRWDGSFARTAQDGTVSPGVPAWEAFKQELERIVLGPLGPGAGLLAGRTSNTHKFDASNGEALALAAASRAELRSAAAASFARLATRFGTGEVTRWREPRTLATVEVQGLMQPPPLPFLERGSWEQAVALRAARRPARCARAPRARSAC